MMKCRECEGELYVKKVCGQVRLKCRTCQYEYQIHEVSSDLDDETVAILSRYNTIIYD